MAKNPLSELKKLISADSPNLKTGTVKSPTSDGAWNVQTASGATFKVYGTAKRGDLILFEKDQIISRLKTVNIVQYTII